MARRSAMQKDLYTQLAEARTPEERDRIVRRLRHAEAGVEGERGRVLDGLLVNGRDPFADLRGGRQRVVYETRPRGETEERTETSMVATEEAETTTRTAGLSITEVAARTGAPPWKLRDLESKGVIGPIGRSANGHDRVYTDSNVEAIEQALATPPKAPHGAATPQAPVQKRASPTVPDRRHEIIYCPECRRQLSEKDYAIEVEDVVMTDHGGITRTLVTCFQHKIIAIKTEFVIRRPGAGS